MSKLNNILPPGTEVTTRIGNVKGIVLGICVRGENLDSVEYHIGTFVNGEHKTYWLYDFEFKKEEKNNNPVGFMRHQNNLLDKQ